MGRAEGTLWILVLVAALALAALAIYLGERGTLLHYFAWVVLVALGASIYFMPAVVAFCRRHHNLLAIAVLNFLLGWTFLGWCVAMVWACTEVRRG